MPKPKVSKTKTLKRALGVVVSRPTSLEGTCHMRREAALAELVKTSNTPDCPPTVTKIAHDLYVLSEKGKFCRFKAEMRPIFGACVLEASRMALEEPSLRHLSNEMAVEMKLLSADHDTPTTKITTANEDTLKAPTESLDVLHIRRYAV
ncbi:hypothetical protein FRB95_000792 [Tulasnella sp. JGI-2019a]|nr:hypothetical protein FRB95_000792 [Tulasnella sp. JGI-2019a]